MQIKADVATTSKQKSKKFYEPPPFLHKTIFLLQKELISPKRQEIDNSLIHGYITTIYYYSSSSYRLIKTISIESTE